MNIPYCPHPIPGNAAGLGGSQCMVETLHRAGRSPVTILNWPYSQMMMARSGTRDKEPSKSNISEDLFFLHFEVLKRS